MNTKKVKWLLVGLCFSIVLAGCSETEEPASAEKEPPQEEQPKGTEAVQNEEETQERFRQAAVHNVEEIVKEKGEYAANDLTDQEEKELQAALEAAPEELTGEEAYSLVVSLVAADIEEEAEKFEAVDPVITIDPSTPEDKIDIPEQQTVNVEILLDASGSMGGEVSGGQKMELAKSAIQRYAADLPDGSNITLRVYGHEGTGAEADKTKSCASNEVVYELGKYDEKVFTDSLGRFAPAGWTPLADAIKAAEEDLKQQTGENIQNVIYVVSDGIETCGGDPVAAAASLSESDIQAEVNIIGFDVDNEGQKQLEEVAKAGKGQYKSVYSESELNDYLKQEHSRLYWEWLAWGNDRYFEILEQSNDIYFDLLSLNNDIYFKSLAENNKMHNLRGQLEKLEKFKDQEAVSQFNELSETRHQTVTQYFRQEQERKDAIRKEIQEKLETKVKELGEEKQKAHNG